MHAYIVDQERKQTITKKQKAEKVDLFNNSNNKKHEYTCGPSLSKDILTDECRIEKGKVDERVARL